MTEKLTWEEIKSRYDNEWVELVEYTWPSGAAYPESGVVRVHAGDRQEFYRLAKLDAPCDSAILFIGRVTRNGNYAIT